MLAKRKGSDEDVEIAWIHREYPDKLTTPVYFTNEIILGNACVPSDSHIVSYIDNAWFDSGGRYPYPRIAVDYAIDLLLGRIRKEDIDTISYHMVVDDLYPRLKTLLSDVMLRTFIVPDQFSMVYPACTNRPNQRDYFLITGPSGSGKTTLARNIIHAYHQKYPDNSIIIITNKDTYGKEPIDKICDISQNDIDVTNIDELKGKKLQDLLAFEKDSLKEEINKKEPDRHFYATRLHKDEWFDFFCNYAPAKKRMRRELKKAKKTIIRSFGPDECEDEIDVEDDDKEIETLDAKLRAYDIKPTKEFKNTLFLFDDIENVTPDKLKDMINNVKGALTKMGRSDNITVLLCNHLHGYKHGREDLNECTHLALFPRMTSSHHLEYTFKEYLRMTPDTIKDVLRKHSNEQWIMVYKLHPRILLTPKRIEVIKD